MFRSITYLAVLATALLVQSSDAAVMTVQIQKVERTKEGTQSASGHRALAKCDEGTVDIEYKTNDGIYVGDIQIGTPPQTFTMSFGTGSMAIWVPNYKVGNHAYYKSADSSTFVKNGTYYQIIYDDSSIVTGFVSVDTIRMGGLTFPNTKIMETSNATGFIGYENMSFDGIFGLGLDVENPYMLPNPVQKMAMDGQLDKPEFAFCMGKNAPQQLTLGGVNTDCFKGPINYVPVVSTGAWWFQMDKVTFGSTVVTSKPMYVEIDTATSVFAAPPSQIQAIMKELGGKLRPDGYYGVDCASQGPALTFTIGGQSYVFEKADYILKGSHGNCILGIADSGDDEIWLFSTLFLEKVYTVFDFGTATTDPRVGFAPSN